MTLKELFDYIDKTKDDIHLRFKYVGRYFGKTYDAYDTITPHDAFGIENWKRALLVWCYVYNISDIEVISVLPKNISRFGIAASYISECYMSCCLFLTKLEQIKGEL